MSSLSFYVSCVYVYHFLVYHFQVTKSYKEIFVLFLQCMFALLFSVSTDPQDSGLACQMRTKRACFRWLNGDLLKYNEWGRNPDEPQGEETENYVAICNKGLLDVSSTWDDPKPLCFRCGYVLFTRCILCIVTGV